MITADDNTSSDDNDGWRNIKGNLKFNNAEHPLSTSSGNVPDIECKKKINNFISLSIEYILLSSFFGLYTTPYVPFLILFQLCNFLILKLLLFNITFYILINII